MRRFRRHVKKGLLWTTYDLWAEGGDNFLGSISEKKTAGKTEREQQASKRWM